MVAGLGFAYLGAVNYGVVPDVIILFLVAFVMGALNAVSNLWNQVFDRDIDAVNCPHRPIPSGQARADVAMQLGGGIAILAVAGSVHFQRPLVTYVVVLILIAAWSYSAPPWRLKRHMWLANLAIATPRGGLGILGAYLVYGQPDLEIAFLGLASAFFVYWGNMTKDLPDVRGDALYGMRTMAVVWGTDLTKRAAFLGMLGGTLLYLVGGHWGVLPALLHFPAWPLYRGPRGPWRFFYVQFALNILGVVLPKVL